MEENSRVQLTAQCLRLLSAWNARFDSLATILGFPEKTRSREIRRYTEGYAFPDDEQILARAKHVVYLGEALRTSYPANPRMAAFWMHQPQKRFNGRTPMQRIEDGDDNALVAVITLVDCAYAWDLNQPGA